MTRDEFNTTVQPLLNTFPDFANWAKGQEQETRDSWARIFTKIYQADLAHGVARLVNGIEGMPYRDQVFSTLARHARLMASDRLRKAESRQQIDMGSRGAMDDVKTDAAMGPCFRKIMAECDAMKADLGVNYVGADAIRGIAERHTREAGLR